MILREAFLGADRFEQFVDRLGINRAALTSRLSILLEAELMTREPPSGKRARYILTPSAHALVPLYRELAEWGSEHLFDAGEPRGEWPSDQPPGSTGGQQPHQS